MYACFQYKNEGKMHVWYQKCSYRHSLKITLFLWDTLYNVLISYRVIAVCSANTFVRKVSWGGGGELNRRKSQHQQKPVAQCVENEENNKSSYVTITYLVDQLTKLGFSGKLHWVIMCRTNFYEFFHFSSNICRFFKRRRVLKIRLGWENRGGKTSLLLSKCSLVLSTLKNRQKLPEIRKK